MPAKRRARNSGAGPAAKQQQQQSKLSFTAGGNKSKVTKSSAQLSAKEKAGQKKADVDIDDVTAASKPETKEILVTEPSQVEEAQKKAGEESALGNITSTPLVAKQTKTELPKPKTESEKLAEKVTDAQIKKYWRAREDDRIAPRVHQEGLSVEEKVLRFFDMSSQYGPAIGITRTKRWQRANKLGLNPPVEVLAVLLKEEKKGNSKIETAQVDKLMVSKLGGDA